MSYITIYFDQKSIILSDEMTQEIDELKQTDGFLFLDALPEKSVNIALQQIQVPSTSGAILYFKDFEKLKNEFFSKFRLIKAAGGIVKNKQAEVLLIYRRGKWDLPKGKLEKGENLSACAVREVGEETGLVRLTLGARVGVTYHTYVQYGVQILKESHWFAMTSTANENLVPQTEEDITEIAWVKQQDLNKYLTNTFPSIAQILKTAFY